MQYTVSIWSNETQCKQRKFRSKFLLKAWVWLIFAFLVRSSYTLEVQDKNGKTVFESSNIGTGCI